MFEDIKPNSERWLSLEDLLNEEWKDIPGFEHLYQVSNYGRVKSLEKLENKNQFAHERIMKTKPNKLGYMTIHFKYKDREYRKLVHILVAELFIPNHDNKPQVLHKKAVLDGGTNCVDNLYWGTQQDNMNDRRRENKFIVTPSTRQKIRKSQLIPINQYDMDGNYLKTWEGAIVVKETLGIDDSVIRKCCKGFKKSAGGYQWRLYKNNTDNIDRYKRSCKNELEI